MRFTINQTVPPGMVLEPTSDEDRRVLEGLFDLKDEGDGVLLIRRNVIVNGADDFILEYQEIETEEVLSDGVHGDIED